MTSETQSPCARCRHAETCSLPPTCHALRYFKQTGLRITPPRRNPCSQVERQKSPSLPIGALKPRIIEGKQVFTNTHLEALMGTRRKRKRVEASHGGHIEDDPLTQRT
jgi:hypothetical protein